MKVKSVTKNIKGSVTKLKIPSDIVKGMLVEDALPILEYMPKKAALDVYKAVQSAKANAINNHGLSEQGLYISEIFVGKGMPIRRYKTAAKGRNRPIHKHFSQVTVVLDETKPNNEDKKLKQVKTKTFTKKETKKDSIKKITQKKVEKKVVKPKKN